MEQITIDANVLFGAGALVFVAFAVLVAYALHIAQRNVEPGVVSEIINGIHAAGIAGAKAGYDLAKAAFDRTPTSIDNELLEMGEDALERATGIDLDGIDDSEPPMTVPPIDPPDGKG